MSLQVPLDQRLTDLQAQIDQLSLTLQLWRQSQDHLQPMERRLSRLTEECSQILDHWKATGERQAQAVDELETRLIGWSDVETRLQRDSTARLEALERSIENEWASLRQLHEAPAKELRDQATTLTEICAAAAGSAQTGLERAEARLSLLESELYRKMDSMSQEIRLALSALRLPGDSRALPAATAPWPLEGVARLHSQLREGGSDEAASTDADTSTGLVRRVGGSRRETNGTTIDVPDPSDRDRPAEEMPANGAQKLLASPAGRLLVGALAIVLAVAVAVVFSLYRQVGAVAAQATEAHENARTAAAAAEQRVQETRNAAAQEIAEAREAALKAQMVSDVLAAPDLLRFNLAGGDAVARLTGQLLLSRSRGIVFSALRLPAPAAGATYQIWLLTRTAPVSVGTFVPDSSGRATLAIEIPGRVPPVIGAFVTTEPEEGSEAPTGPPILTRAQ